MINRGIIVASVFGVALVVLVIAMLRYGIEAKPRRTAQAQSFSGTLDVRNPNDIRVGGRRVILCRTVNILSPSLASLAGETLQKEFKGRSVACNPVGLGTSCDGRSPTMVAGAFVAQCRLDKGNDLAEELVSRKILGKR